MKLEITEKQQAFIDSTADETLFGGAAGGGKSYAQLIDALLYALKYNGSMQLILRRTFPELERTLILKSFLFYPKEIAKYNTQKKTWVFVNGSMIVFGFSQNEADITQYDGTEWDVVRFDELTHFTEWQYMYLFTRSRGTKDRPRYIKSSTNPGNIGHTWVKERFVDVSPPEQIYTYTVENPKKGTSHTKTRLFIPSFLYDNKFIDRDAYEGNLLMQDEITQKRLLYGDWDLAEGGFFSEFDRAIHIVKPFDIPSSWRVIHTIDYGLDMLASLWIALDHNENAYVCQEIYMPNLIISAAASEINKNEMYKPWIRYAPPDLFSRRQETGKSATDIFYENGLIFNKSSNERANGWMALKEWLKVYTDEQGIKTSRLKIFNTCTNLIRCLPALQTDPKYTNDIMQQPHELTHAPDALRGFAIMHKKTPKQTQQRNEYQDFINYGG